MSELQEEVEEDLAIEDSAAIQAFFSLEPRTRGKKSMQLPDNFKPSNNLRLTNRIFSQSSLKQKYKSMRYAVLKKSNQTDRFASLPLSLCLKEKAQEQMIKSKKHLSSPVKFNRIPDGDDLDEIDVANTDEKKVSKRLWTVTEEHEN